MLVIFAAFAATTSVLVSPMYTQFSGWVFNCSAAIVKVRDSAWIPLVYRRI